MRQTESAYVFILGLVFGLGRPGAESPSRPPSGGRLQSRVIHKSLRLPLLVLIRLQCGNVRPAVCLSVSLGARSSPLQIGPSQLPHTNYTASNPRMSVSRSHIIPSLFHLESLCSSPPTSSLTFLLLLLLRLPCPTLPSVSCTRGPSSSSFFSLGSITPGAPSSSAPSSKEHFVVRHHA